MTTQQMLILALVAVMGFGLLGMAAFIVLSGGQRPASVLAAQPATPTTSWLEALPATWTPQPAAPQGLITPPAPTPSLLPVPASCAQGGSESLQGTFSRIIDVNTVEVKVDGALVPVGFAGISVLPAGSAKHSSTQAEQAIQRLRDLLDGYPITLVRDVTQTDPNGHLPRYVFAGGRFINYELVRDGLAEVSSQSPDHACADFLQAAEQQARSDKIGLWIPTPVPTSTFVPFVTLSAESPACDCAKRPTCFDFDTHEQAQACYNACNDYNSQMDGDRDGIACEGLP